MLAKYDQGHPQTAMRSAVVIGGWGIYMLIIAPRAFRIQKLESRNPDKIDKLEDLKVLKPSPDLLNNVIIGHCQLRLIIQTYFVLPYMGMVAILVKYHIYIY